ncbi:MAG: NlpC/P60 family protein [Planctomycetaceae bacterium]|jgi:cell wall-associated NlpC family hydrolase
MKTSCFQIVGRFVAIVALLLPVLLCPPVMAQEKDKYVSPYRLKFRHSAQQLAAGFQQPPWNNPHEQSELPHSRWYDRETEKKFGSWGPVARQYPAPAGLERRDSIWLQDRVIYTASLWIGTPYQHHHIPDWDPPAHWPWQKVAYGRNSRGVDCSNFSSFYYNFGLGVKLDTGIHQQAERTVVRGPGGRGQLRIEVIKPRSYEEMRRELLPGDLLYIKNRKGVVGHVILWLGEVGVSPDGTPLVIDSTGGNHVDSNGHKIPIGVHIRPMPPRSWYAEDLSHAHRIIPGYTRVEPGEAPPPEEGGADESFDRE